LDSTDRDHCGSESVQWTPEPPPKDDIFIV
jgi:hypothetical protein